jgi:hypothetical protein
MQALGVVAVLCGLLSAACSTSAQRGLRSPTATERRDLTNAFSDLTDRNGTIRSIRLAKSNAAYASVMCRCGGLFGPSNTPMIYVFERERWHGGEWGPLYQFAPGRQALVACLFPEYPARLMPAPRITQEVVHELFGVTCPSRRALHGRRASPGVVTLLKRAYRTYGLSRNGPALLSSVCISSVDSTWAGAAATYPDTGGPIWFHRSAGHWSPAFPLGLPPSINKRPSPAIVLSLALCADYDPVPFL